MGLYLRQSTEVTEKIGPFLDKTDGVTEEVGLAGNGTELSKGGAAFGAGPVLGTHDAEGWYPVTLTTTHTNTVGTLRIKSHDAATHLPVWHEWQVLEEAVYDALFAASANTFTGAADSNAVRLVDTLTTYTGNTPQTGDSFARLGTPAGSSIAADIASTAISINLVSTNLGSPGNFGGGATIAANLSDIEAQTDDIGAAGAGLTAVALAASQSFNNAGQTTSLPATLSNGVAHGGTTATLQLGSSSGAAFIVASSNGSAVTFTSTGGNGQGLLTQGHGTGNGQKNVGGATGDGLHSEGGATSGYGFHALSQGGNYAGALFIGTGSGAGARFEGGLTGNGLKLLAGATSGYALDLTATADADCFVANSGTGIITALPSTDWKNAQADAVLSRNVSNVEATAPEHSLCFVVLAASEASLSGSTLTIKRTDGSTTFATKTISTASRDPIASVT